MTSRNVPRLRFKGFGDEWKSVKISSMYDTIKNAFVGTATPFYTDSENGEFYLESNNVKDGKINEHTKVFINKDFYLNQEHNWLHTNDLVMVQSGHVGHTAIITKKYNNTAAHALIMFKNVKNGFSSVFINDEFQNSFYRNKIRLITTGNTIKHVLASEVKKINLSYPSLKEQQRIGNFFSKLDHLIDLHSQKFEQLKKLKRGYLQKMFPQKDEKVPRLRFSGFSGKWKEVRLKNISRCETSKYTQGQLKKEPNKGMYKVFDVSGISGSINVYDQEKNYISIVKDGSGVGTVNLRPAKTSIINTMNYIINDNSNIRYLFYLLETFNFYRYKIGTGIPHIYYSDYSKEKVIIPSIEEQEKIGNFFNNLDKKIKFEKNKIEILNRQKKAYLQKMFI